MKPELIFLGTGKACVTKCYNTCFLLDKGGEYLLVDGGGGNGILRQLQLAGISRADIHHMFISHAHTDHLFGAIWMLRTLIMEMHEGIYQGNFHVYANAEVMAAVKAIMGMTLSRSYNKELGQRVQLVELVDGQQEELLGMPFTFHDVGGGWFRQFGFTAVYEANRRLVCLGDQPFLEELGGVAQGADWLLCEAFCLLEDEQTFHAYEYHHNTAKDAAMMAEKYGVKNLVLYHTEDTDLPHRKQRYSCEAASVFRGTVFVPDDFERIALHTSHCNR